MLSPKSIEIIKRLGLAEGFVECPKAEEADLIRRGFVDLFVALAKDAHIKRRDASTLVVPMYDAKTNPAPGEYLPEIHFVVRKVDDGISNSGSEDTIDEGAGSPGEAGPVLQVQRTDDPEAEASAGSDVGRTV